MITDCVASLFRSSSRSVHVFRNASFEDPSMSLNDPALYESIAAGMTSAAGIPITHEGSLKLAAVWQAVSLVSGDVAKLPLYPYRREEDDDREIDTAHPAYVCTSIKANDEKSAFYFWRDLMVHALLWPGGYAYIDRSGPRWELFNLLPDRTAPEWVTLEGGRKKYIYVTEVNGKLEPLDPSEVLHIRGMSIDGMHGCDLVKYARDTWGLALAALNFESKFFKNGARKGGILEIPLGIPKPARDTIEEGFRKTYEDGENPFKTVILRDGAKFHDGQVTPEQGQVIELRDTQKREVASYFNIPPSKLGIRDSVSYNSFEQDNLSYLWGCLSHWLEPITSECNIKLLTDRELLVEEKYFEHNVSKFSQSDWRTTNEGLEVMRRNEVINANEWRRKMNMNRRKDPGGEEYINPNTRSPNTPPKAEGKAEPPRNAHRELIISASSSLARRLGRDARRAAESPAKYEAFVNRLLGESFSPFNDVMGPIVAAYSSVWGGDESQLLNDARQSLFVVLPELAAFMEPPHSAADLPRNVDRLMTQYEQTIGGRIADLITGVK